MIMKTIQSAVDSFHVPQLLKGAKREYYKAGAAAMALHIAKQAKPEYAALNAVAENAKDCCNHHREHTEPCKCTECCLFDALAALAALRKQKEVA
jgi:hypothetical protein